MRFASRVAARYRVTATSSVASGLIDQMSDIVRTEKFVKEWVDDHSGQFRDEDFYDQLGLEAPDDWEEEEHEGKEWEPTDEQLTEAAKDWLDDRWGDFEYDFPRKAKDKDGMLLAWRCIMVDNVDEFVDALKNGKYVGDHKGLGVYYAWSERSAECHWGKGTHAVIVEALLPKESIDVEDTLWANMQMSTGKDEQEVRVKPGSKVFVNDISWDRRSVLSEQAEPLEVVA